MVKIDQLHSLSTMNCRCLGVLHQQNAGIIACQQKIIESLLPLLSLTLRQPQSLSAEKQQPLQPAGEFPNLQQQVQQEKGDDDERMLHQAPEVVVLDGGNLPIFPVAGIISLSSPPQAMELRDLVPTGGETDDESEDSNEIDFSKGTPYWNHNLGQIAAASATNNMHQARVSLASFFSALLTSIRLYSFLLLLS